MTIKSYAEVLRWAIQSQIEYVREEAEKEASTIDKAMYFEGVERGLQIALAKIDASMFLAEK